jgi:hypothetical protein
MRRAPHPRGREDQQPAASRGRCRVSLVLMNARVLYVLEAHGARPLRLFLSRATTGHNNNGHRPSRGEIKLGWRRSASTDHWEESLSAVPSVRPVGVAHQNRTHPTLSRATPLPPKSHAHPGVCRYACSEQIKASQRGLDSVLSHLHSKGRSPTRCSRQKPQHRSLLVP